MIEAKSHTRSELSFSLYPETLYKQIALYEDDREVWSDVLFGGEYGGPEENTDMLLKAYYSANNIVNLCADFMGTLLKNLEQDEYDKKQRSLKEVAYGYYEDARGEQGVRPERSGGK